jgi:hypothetical protein
VPDAVVSRPGLVLLQACGDQTCVSLERLVLKGSAVPPDHVRVVLRGPPRG